jgi:ATP-dependent protease HslVU (ClpYQ) peptidase subunit
MTIICAAKDAESNEIWIGSDTVSTYGPDIPWTNTGSKWIQHHGGLCIGLSGPTRTDALLHEFNQGAWTDPWKFCAALRAAIIEDGWEAEDRTGPGRPQRFDINGLIVFGKELWDIDGTITPSKAEDTFVAIGAGLEYAYGAQYAIMFEDAKQRVRVALAAAINLSPSCGGKIWMEEVV